MSESSSSGETNTVLCKWDELGDPGSRAFSLKRGDGELEFFVVRKGDRLAAYLNKCPHTGAPLNWQPDQFLDVTGGFIQCSLHGALFGVNDGYCLRGPCVGDSLRALPCAVIDGEVVLLEEGR